MGNCKGEKKAQKKSKAYYQDLQRRFRNIAGVDIKICLYKWYPWSYRNYVPTLVLQGWYDVSRAKRYFLKKYGPEALKYVKFSKGKTILESDEFKVGKTLYINGMWRLVSSKILIPTESTAKVRNHSFSRWSFKRETMASLKKRTRGHNDRVAYDKEISYYAHERQPIPSLKKKENLRISKVQEIKQQRKKTLFEEPS